MLPFLRQHWDRLRSLSCEQQIKIGVKIIAIIAVLSAAAHWASSRSFDKRGLARLAIEMPRGAKERSTTGSIRR
jgi:hypothetical protein